MVLRTVPSMLTNTEAQHFFAPLSAHSDVATELAAAVKRLGEYEIVRANRLEYGALYAVTKNIAFCGASGMRDTYWRLRPGDIAIALSSGADPAPVGPDWVRIQCFRADRPTPDLSHWALRAYDFARTGA